MGPSVLGERARLTERYASKITVMLEQATSNEYKLLPFEKESRNSRNIAYMNYSTSKSRRQILKPNVYPDYSIVSTNAMNSIISSEDKPVTMIRMQPHYTDFPKVACPSQ